MATPKKVALVTGSTSGIGLATARALAKRGVNIIITGFGEDETIGSIVDEMKGYGVRADYVSADLSNVTEIDTLWSEVTRIFPNGIDILVNCAGIYHPNPVESFQESEWNLHLDVLLKAPHQLIKRCLSAMKTKGWGRIVNVSSTAGVIGHANNSAYVSAKHGLIGLTKSVALESAAHGVTCNAVCPAVVETPLLKTVYESLAALQGATLGQVQEMFLKTMPTGKVIQPEQVAELVEFLCLSNASSQMTGATYLIDGGATAQ